MTKKKPKKFKHVGRVCKNSTNISPRSCAYTRSLSIKKLLEFLVSSSWPRVKTRGWRCVKVFVEE